MRLCVRVVHGPLFVTLLMSCVFVCVCLFAWLLCLFVLLMALLLVMFVRGLVFVFL